MKPPDRVHSFGFLVVINDGSFATNYQFEALNKAYSYFQSRIKDKHLNYGVTLYLVNSFNDERYTLAWFQNEPIVKLVHESKLLHLLLGKIHLMMNFVPTDPVYNTPHGQPFVAKIVDEEFPSHLKQESACRSHAGERGEEVFTPAPEPVKDHLVISIYPGNKKPYVSGAVFTKEEAERNALTWSVGSKQGASFHVAKIVADVQVEETKEVKHTIIER